MKDIVIVGSSGFAREVAFLIKEINKGKEEWNFLGFVDENVGEKVGDYEVVMNDEQLDSYNRELYVIIAIGSTSLLHKLASRFEKNYRLKFPNIFHPNCIGDWDKIEFGKGNIVTAGNIFTTDIKVGNFNIFNLNGTIGHDVVIGNFNVINPTCNISGNVTLKDQVFVGTGAQVLQGLSVSSDIVIGASALVTKSLENSGVYIGSPAKPMNK